MKECRSALGLRQHDGVGSRLHNGIEIGIDEAGREPVDAHAEERAFGFARGRLEESRRACARLPLAVRRNRVLEVDDDGVGAAGERLVELLATVGRREQKRAHQRGRIRIRACRRHSATS